MAPLKPKTAARKNLDLALCPCAGGNLDKFIQPAMLAALAREPLHGYLIVARLRDLPMFQCQAPDLTGVYRYLKAMEKRGLVVCEWDLSASGPAKRVFRITAGGRKCLRQWLATLEAYSGQLASLLQTVRASAGRR